MAGNLKSTTYAIAAGAVVSIAPAAVGRVYLAVQNIGTGRVNLAFDADPVADEGWALAPAEDAGGQGGAVVWEDRRGCDNEVRARAKAATKLVVLEG